MEHLGINQLRAKDAPRNLIGLDKLELAETLTVVGLEPFRAKQVWAWIYYAHCKNKVKIHRGLRQHRPSKMIDFLLAYS